MSGVRSRAAFELHPSDESMGTWTDDTWDVLGSGATQNLGAGSAIPLLDESITNQKLVLNKGLLQGSPAAEAPAVIGWNVGGNVRTQLRYSGHDAMFAAALGHENPALAASGGSPQDEGSGVYLHVYEAAPELKQGPWAGTNDKICRGMLGFDVGAEGFKGIKSAMIQGFTINLAGQDSTITWDVVGRKLTTSTVVPNTASGIQSAAWTPPANWNTAPAAGRITLPQTRVILYRGGTPTECFVESLELSYRNMLVTNDRRGGSPYIEEPRWDRQRQIRLSCNLVRRQVNDNWPSAMENEVNALILIECLGPSLGPNPAALWIGLPATKLVSAEDPIRGPGVIKERLVFEAHEPSGSETGFAALFEQTNRPLEDIALVHGSEIFVGTRNTVAGNQLV